MLVRTLVSSVKTKVISDELLVVLGSSDNRWAVLDEVAARNLQKGLVTFELTESFDRFSTQFPLTRLDVEIQIDLIVRRTQRRPLQNSVGLFLHHPARKDRDTNCQERPKRPKKEHEQSRQEQDPPPRLTCGRSGTDWSGLTRQ